MFIHTMDVFLVDERGAFRSGAKINDSAGYVDLVKNAEVAVFLVRVAPLQRMMFFDWESKGW